MALGWVDAVLPTDALPGPVTDGVEVPLREDRPVKLKLGEEEEEGEEGALGEAPKLALAALPDSVGGKEGDTETDTEDDTLAEELGVRVGAEVTVGRPVAVAAGVAVDRGAEAVEDMEAVKLVSAVAEKPRLELSVAELQGVGVEAVEDEPVEVAITLPLAPAPRLAEGVVLEERVREKPGLTEGEPEAAALLLPLTVVLMAAEGVGMRGVGVDVVDVVVEGRGAVQVAAKERVGELVVLAVGASGVAVGGALVELGGEEELVVGDVVGVPPHPATSPPKDALGVTLTLLLWLPPLPVVEVGEGEPAALSVCTGVLLADWEIEAVVLGDRLPLPLLLPTALALGSSDTVACAEEVKLLPAVPVGRALVGVSKGEALAVLEGVPVREGVELPTGVPVPEALCAGERVAVAVSVSVATGERDTRAVPVPAG